MNFAQQYDDSEKQRLESLVRAAQSGDRAA